MSERKSYELVQPSDPATPDGPVAFVLKERLEKGGTAKATRWEWDPRAKSGEGDYVATQEEIKVRDTRSWWGPAEAGIKGKAVRKPSQKGIVLEIDDLDCEPEQQ
jgi:hypothetical protein